MSLVIPRVLSHPRLLRGDAFSVFTLENPQIYLGFCSLIRIFATRNFKIKRIMATLILQVPDESLVSKVKQACKMLVGVASVKVQRPAKAKS